ncbi:MAG: YmdB family metallophosphoesterase, partial [Dehalococcoidia bacterium]|nr:YmdB family metallophosphoesterase [Dehalococcoidia bacterium]
MRLRRGRAFGGRGGRSLADDQDVEGGAISEVGAGRVDNPPVRDACARGGRRCAVAHADFRRAGGPARGVGAGRDEHDGVWLSSQQRVVEDGDLVGTGAGSLAGVRSVDGVDECGGGASGDFDGAIEVDGGGADETAGSALGGEGLDADAVGCGRFALDGGAAARVVAVDGGVGRGVGRSAEPGDRDAGALLVDGDQAEVLGGERDASGGAGDREGDLEAAGGRGEEGVGRRADRLPRREDGVGAGRGAGPDGDLHPAGVAAEGVGAEIEVDGEEAVGDGHVVFRDGGADLGAAGFGVTPETARELLEAGADCLTSGNHIWKRREVLPYIDQEPRLLRPANYPDGAPGRGVGMYVVADREVAVVNLLG